MPYNHYTRQETYDKLRHHIGQAEHSTISMALHDDWKLYNQHRRSAYGHIVHAIYTMRELFKHDEVMMGAYHHTRVSFYVDALYDLRNILQYVNVEHNLIQDDKEDTILKQRRGMSKAWSRVRSTVSTVRTCYAVHAGAEEA